MSSNADRLKKAMANRSKSDENNAAWNTNHASIATFSSISSSDSTSRSYMPTLCSDSTASTSDFITNDFTSKTKTNSIASYSSIDSIPSKQRLYEKNDSAAASSHPFVLPTASSFYMSLDELDDYNSKFMAQGYADRAKQFSRPSYNFHNTLHSISDDSDDSDNDDDVPLYLRRRHSDLTDLIDQTQSFKIQESNVINTSSFGLDLDLDSVIRSALVESTASQKQNNTVRTSHHTRIESTDLPYNLYPTESSFYMPPSHNSLHNKPLDPSVQTSPKTKKRLGDTVMRFARKITN